MKMKQAPNTMAQVANRILTPKNNHLHHQNKKKMAQTDRQIEMMLTNAE